MKNRILLMMTLGFAFSAGSAIAQEARNAAPKVEISHTPLNYVRKEGSNLWGGCNDVAVTMTNSAALVVELCGTSQIAFGKDTDTLLSYRGGLRFSKRTGSRLTTFAPGAGWRSSWLSQRRLCQRFGFLTRRRWRNRRWTEKLVRPAESLRCGTK